MKSDKQQNVALKLDLSKIQTLPLAQASQVCGATAEQQGTIVPHG